MVLDGTPVLSTADTKKLQAVLDKMPKPCKQGSDEQILLSKQGCQAFQEVVSGLWLVPGVRERTARFVAEQRVAMKATEEKQGKDCLASIGTVSQLDPTWMSGFIT